MMNSLKKVASMSTIDGRLGKGTQKITAPAKYQHSKFTFDGTMPGLVQAAQAIGLKVGNILQADFGDGFRRYVLVAAPHDEQCHGVWANEICPPIKRKRTNRG
jgi:hypothetical protein